MPISKIFDQSQTFSENLTWSVWKIWMSAKVGPFLLVHILALHFQGDWKESELEKKFPNSKSKLI